MGYEYPLDYSTYSKDEIVVIIDFLSYLEDNVGHYEYAIIKEKYNKYRNVISSKMEEKRICEEFLKLSNINIYKVLREFGL